MIQRRVPCFDLPISLVSAKKWAKCLEHKCRWFSLIYGVKVHARDPLLKKVFLRPVMHEMPCARVPTSKTQADLVKSVTVRAAHCRLQCVARGGQKCDCMWEKCKRVNKGLGKSCKNYGWVSIQYIRVLPTHLGIWRLCTRYICISQLVRIFDLCIFLNTFCYFYSAYFRTFVVTCWWCSHLDPFHYLVGHQFGLLSGNHTQSFKTCLGQNLMHPLLQEFESQSLCAVLKKTTLEYIRQCGKLYCHANQKIVHDHLGLPQSIKVQEVNWNESTRKVCMHLIGS